MSVSTGVPANGLMAVSGLAVPTHPDRLAQPLGGPLAPRRDSEALLGASGASSNG